MTRIKDIDEWIAWIKDIGNDVTGLLDSRATFQRYVEIINNNKRIQTPPHFHLWVKNNYAISVVMTIRRHLDKTRGTKAFIKLLEEIKSNAQNITKVWHRSIYIELGDSFADMDFEKLAGKDKYFDYKIAEIDIKKLNMLGKKIDDYANSYLAHWSNNPTKIIPKYNEVDNFIDEFELIVKRYILLFTGSHFSTLKPVVQYDWGKIFKESWIR